MSTLAFFERFVGMQHDRAKTAEAGYPSHINRLRERAEYAKARANELEPKLTEVQATIGDLDKREKELTEQLLVP